jgi:energy-coupling factor transporter ATP-binding protein EcfA2
MRDLDVSGLAGAFATRTESGRAALLARLEVPLTEEKAVAQRRAEIRGIRERCKDAATAARVSAARGVLAETEADCLSVADAAADKRHAEYYNQLLWGADSWFAWLNRLGWVNEAMVFFRTVFLPGTAVLMPLLIFLAPLILTHLLADKGAPPLTFGRYVELVTAAFKKMMPAGLGKSRFAGRGGIAEIGEQMVQLGVAGAMFVASIWNQISAALAMRRVAADMRHRAASVRRATEAVRDLAAALGVDVGTTGAPAWGTSDLGVFGEAWNDPARVRQLLADAGHLDMLAAVALAKRTCFARTGTSLQLKDLYHPALAAGERVYNSIVMDPSATATKNHVLLTGPNRGGKSTFLKSLGAAIVLNQTVGVVFARRAELPVFGSIVTALSPADRLGEMSLFEAEIEFAKGVRETIRGATQPVFLMMDEIFHGTNAHDGVEASQVFLDELYGREDEPGVPVFSVVSTHYMDLPARYGKAQTQNLCMDASVDPADPDRLIYTYRLCPGVNRFSSVREILRERGLLTVKESACGSSAQKTSVSAAE